MRDLPLLEVAAQEGDVLIKDGAQLTQLRHGTRDAGQEGGEDHQGEEEDCNSVRALRRVARNNLHRCRRELRQGPVHGCKVQVQFVRIDAWKEGLLNPGLLVDVAQVDAEGVESACDNVVEPHDEQGQLQHVDQDVDVLRRDLVLEDAQELGNLCQAQQSQGPQDTQDPQRFAGARQGCPVPSSRSRHDPPVGCHKHDVQREPRGEVPDGDPLRVQLFDALDVEACEEGVQDVAGPIEQCQPEHEGGEGHFRRLKRKLDRNEQRIPGNEHQAEEIPRQAGARAGPLDPPAVTFVWRVLDHAGFGGRMCKSLEGSRVYEVGHVLLLNQPGGTRHKDLGCRVGRPP
mmetsp:Transcript_41426/g.107207  ORF Transcript_41426/g.107207 Transcript_41426/m.107207 type:complete len:344 (+) Transcript_41426:1219-2250(+)